MSAVPLLNGAVSSRADTEQEHEPRSAAGGDSEKMVELDADNIEMQIASHIDDSPIKQVPSQSDRLFECGLGRWRPRWLQRFALSKCVLCLLCWACLVQGMIANGLVPSVLSTIETRFGLRSAQLGTIMQSYDIGYIVFCVPVSYFGGRSSKPVYLSIGLLLLAAGSALFTLPHYLSGTMSPADLQANQTYSNLCHQSGPVIDCSVAGRDIHHSEPHSTRTYLALFCVAHALHGIGATPLFTLGVSYLHENVNTAHSSAYIGIFYSFAIFGPAVGFLLSSKMLTLHTDFLTGTAVHLSVASDGWVGAWWFGFHVASGLALMAVLPLLCFPHTLPGENTTMSGPVSVIEEPPQSAFCEDLAALPRSVLRVLSNFTYLLVTLAAAGESILITGVSTFMAKYMEQQFDVSASRSSLLLGCIMVPVAGAGTMLSGFIVQRCALSVSRTLCLSAVLCVCTMLLSPMFLLYCPQAPLAGLHTSYDHWQTDMGDSPPMFASRARRSRVAQQKRAHCQQGCGCTQNVYEPVCAQDPLHGLQVTMHSPCHAACDRVLGDKHNGNKTYSECACAPDSVVSAGACSVSCNTLVYFLLLFAPLCLCTFAIGVPLLSVVLKVVDEKERSFALGIQWIVVRCLGNMPAPALFGRLFDAACLARHHLARPCSAHIDVGARAWRRGRCIAYDHASLARHFLGFALICQALTLAMLVAAWFWHKYHTKENVTLVTKSESGAKQGKQVQVPACSQTNNQL